MPMVGRQWKRCAHVRFAPRLRVKWIITQLRSVMGVEWIEPNRPRHTITRNEAGPSTAAECIDRLLKGYQTGQVAASEESPSQLEGTHAKVTECTESDRVGKRAGTEQHATTCTPPQPSTRWCAGAERAVKRRLTAGGATARPASGEKSIGR